MLKPDTYYDALLGGQNGCGFTSVEQKVSTGFPGVAMYKDANGRVRLNYSTMGECISGLLLHPLGKTPASGYVIAHVFTLDGHRRCGYAQSLLFVARKMLTKINHNDNLTPLGQLWLNKVEGLK